MALRDPTPEEVSKLIDSGVILNEPGADLLTRWLTKTFAANPQQAKEFLERRGFEVMESDRAGKLQFAIRNKAVSQLVGENKNPWRVLDPEGFDKGDIADIAFEVFVAGPVIAATTTAGGVLGAEVGAVPGGLAGGLLGLVSGGPPGAAVGAPGGAGAGAVTGGAIGAAGGGAFGGALTETARQAAGAALGVNTEADLGAVARATGLNAVAPGVAQRIARFPQGLLKVAKRANTTLANIGRNVAARVIPTTEEVLTTGAASSGRVSRLVNETQLEEIQLLDRFRGFIARMRLPENRFPESREIDAILDTARPVPIKNVLKILESRQIRPIGEQRIGLRGTRRIAQDIAKRLGAATPEEAMALRISPKEAQALQDIIQDHVDFSGRPGEKFSNKVLKQAQAELGRLIAASVPTRAARVRYSKLNGYGAVVDTLGRFHPGNGVVGKMEALNELNKKAGKHAQTATAEKFFASVTGPGRTQDKRLVEQLDRLFGTNFVEEGTVTRLSRSFSRDAPKLTTTGDIIGTKTGSTLIGSGIGTALGGVEGGLIGAPIGWITGFALASPKGMLRTGRALTAGEQKIKAGIGKVGRKLGQVEPLQDYLARSAGGAVASGQGRVRAVPDQQVEIKPHKKLSTKQQSAVNRIVDEVNKIPGLTGTQRMDEIERRVKAQGVAP